MVHRSHLCPSALCSKETQKSRCRSAVVAARLWFRAPYFHPRSRRAHQPTRGARESAPCGTGAGDGLRWVPSHSGRPAFDNKNSETEGLSSPGSGHPDCRAALGPGSLSTCQWLHGEPGPKTTFSCWAVPHLRQRISKLAGGNRSCV